MSKRTRVFILIVSLIIAAGCDTGANTNMATNKANRANMNSNVAIVMNTNMATNMSVLPALCVDRRECPKAEYVGENSKGCPCYKCNKGRPNEETLCFKNKNSNSQLK